MDQFIIGELASINARRCPDKLATVFGDKKTTWLDFDRSTNMLANMLLGSSFKRGDRLAILSKNSADYLEWYFGCAKAGIIAVPINYRLAEQEMVNLLSHADPKGIILGQDYIEAGGRIREKVKLPYFMADESGGKDWLFDYSKEKQIHGKGQPNIEVNENDIFCIMYTSGTTGLPKGAMSTHRNYVFNCLSVIHAQGITPQDINLIAPPLYHAGALFHSLSYMMLGCTQVVLKQFESKETLSAIQEHRITSCLMIPTMLNFLLNDPDINKSDMSTLKKIFYGGGPMPIALLEKAMALLNDVEFTQGYGLTETLEATFLLPEDHVISENPKVRQRLRSAGRETLLYEVRIVDLDNNEVPINKSGEIWLNGPSVIKGFWGDREQSSNSIRKGWFKTGDIGTLDEGRYLYILDREKDMIISGGENIYTKEVEDALHTHPAVLEAAVIGVPDPEWGENVKAVVVLKNGTNATQEELISFCKERLARYKRPKSIEFVYELPKNPSGKILKRELRERFKK